MNPPSKQVGIGNTGRRTLAATIAGDYLSRFVSGRLLLGGLLFDRPFSFVAQDE